MNTVIEVAWKSVGLLILVSVVAYIAKRSSPALRHRLWALSFVGLALLPFLTLRLPEIRVERPGAPIYHSTSVAHAAPVPQIEPVAPQKPTPFTLPEHQEPSFPAQLLVVLWGIGVAVAVARLAVQMSVARRLTRGSEDITGDLMLELPPHTRIVRTPAVTVPMTFGFVRPTILLPADSLNWPMERLRAVLLHEGAHVRRGDWAWLIFSKLVATFYWPNPLVLWAMGRMRVESELASDEAVIQAGMDARNYASTLLDLAEALRGQRVEAALPIVDTAPLKSRIAAILANSNGRRPLGRVAAVAILVFGIAVVVPYAAMRIVSGPAVIRDGIFELGDGHQAEIVAITEMEGNRAVSWDIHGALLPRPFPIGKWDIQALPSKDTKPGEIVRYVIFRIDGESNEYPMIQSSTGEDIRVNSYMGLAGDIDLNIQDALGGTYRVVRLVAPAGAQSLGLKVKVPTTDWRLYAYVNYKKGEVTGLLNPTVDLHLSPQMPAYGKGTEATLVLPDDLADKETTVRFLPEGTGGARFIQMGGNRNVTASTSQSPEKITRVEVLARSLQMVSIPNLPIMPNANAAYAPRHFLPQETVKAVDGIAKMPDGQILTVDSLSEKTGRPWDYHGIPLAGNRRGAALPTYVPTLANPTDRTLALRIAVSPDASTAPQTLYDGEGWPLLKPYSVVFGPESYADYYGRVVQGVNKTDISTRVPVGKFTTVASYVRGALGTTWIASERKGWVGVLRVEFPPETATDTAGQDVTIRALDAKGKEVTRPDGSQSSSSGPGYVEFDLPMSVEERVVKVEIRTRPFAWVRFPNVPLTSK